MVYQLKSKLIKNVQYTNTIKTNLVKQKQKQQLKLAFYDFANI